MNFIVILQNVSCTHNVYLLLEGWPNDYLFSVYVNIDWKRIKVMLHINFSQPLEWFSRFANAYLVKVDVRLKSKLSLREPYYENIAH
jgi:hypothetical protein